MTVASVRLTPAGIARFERWFADHARGDVRIDQVVFDLCDSMVDRIGPSESLTYELHGQYTTDGRPALITMERADLDVEVQTQE